MRISATLPAVALTFAAALTTAPVAQRAAPPPSRPSSSPAQPGEADPGVRPFRLIDRDEIRVSRVELQPGAVRRVHAHDDVEYHVWAPVSGTLEITIGDAAPQAAAPGQAFFLKRGTPHGFRNTGTTPAAVFEIFVKKSATSASSPVDSDQVLAAVAPEAARPLRRP
jgi:quercetin dioxygenase-like cupin family protein